MTFQERVIEKIKEFFPDARLVNLVEIDGQNFGFGIAQPKHEGGRFLHYSCIKESDEYSDDDYSADDDLIDNALDELWFYKAPSEIYIRSISGDISTKNAYVRLTLGYKA